MGIVRRAITWLVLAAAIMSALSVRFLSLQLLEWFQRRHAESALPQLPAVTERFLASSWYYTVVPLVVAAAAVVAVLWIFQRRSIPESKYHALAVISSLVLYSSFMIQASTILAFVILPTALAGI